MKIGNIHREVAKLLWEGDMTIAEIAQLKGKTERLIYFWKKEPEFDQLLKDLEENHRTSAKREAIRWARRSVKTLVKLQDIAIKKDETGQVISEEFKFGSDVARKAAVDLLEMAEVKVKEGEGVGIGNNPIFIIQTDGSQSKTQDKAQGFSKQFRLE